MPKISRPSRNLLFSHRVLAANDARIFPRRFHPGRPGCPRTERLCLRTHRLSKEHKIYVVVGGGKIAREYIGKARALGASEIFCDQIGIGATKLNAALLIAALGAKPTRRSLPATQRRLQAPQELW
jgi:hypothetical protein